MVVIASRKTDSAMSAGTLKIKERPTANGNFTDAQADNIVGAFLQADKYRVTKNFLRAERRGIVIRIVGIQTGINGLIAAIVIFLLG